MLNVKSVKTRQRRNETQKGKRPTPPEGPKRHNQGTHKTHTYDLLASTVAALGLELDRPWTAVLHVFKLALAMLEVVARYLTWQELSWLSAGCSDEMKFSC